MERCLLAGIPVWWRPSDHPGLRVSLMFRAGRIDETLLTAGRLSALMAWALLPTFPAYVSASGSFGGVVSHIDLYGPPDAVASVLGTIAARLHGPTDAEWAESEAAVLRMMADEDDFDTLLAERFGVCGPGAGSLRGPALQTLTAGWLREVGAGFFASGNAALALDGDVPVGLQLPLPAGGRQPAPPLPATREPIPRVYVTPDRLVLSGLVPTSDASVLAQGILRTRLEERLRHRLRSTYAVSCATFNFGETTLAVFSADVSAERFAEASGIVAETAWLLSAVPAEERELKDHAFATVQALRAPEVEAEEPFGAAHRELLGQAPRTVAERIAAVEGIGLADLRTPLASLFGSAMLGAPIDQAVDVDWPTDAVPREGRLEGRRHRPRRGAEHLFEPLCDVVVADGRLQLGSASSRFLGRCGAVARPRLARRTPHRRRRRRPPPDDRADAVAWRTPHRRVRRPGRRPAPHIADARPCAGRHPGPALVYEEGAQAVRRGRAWKSPAPAAGGPGRVPPPDRHPAAVAAHISCAGGPGRRHSRRRAAVGQRVHLVHAAGRLGDRRFRHQRLRAWTDRRRAHPCVVDRPDDPLRPRRDAPSTLRVPWCPEAAGGGHQRATR